MLLLLTIDNVQLDGTLLLKLVNCIAGCCLRRNEQQQQWPRHAWLGCISLVCKKGHMNNMQASRKLRHVTCCADTVIPSSVMTIISPGKTSRTRSNPMGPKAQSSDATHHSSPLSDFLLPRTSGLDNIHCPRCKHPLAYKSTVPLQGRDQ